MWELAGRVDGVECYTLGMSYSPHHNALLVADGINCRILVLNPQNGSVRQVMPLGGDIGVVAELCKIHKQIVVHHHLKNRKVKVSYYSSE